MTISAANRRRHALRERAQFAAQNRYEQAAFDRTKLLPAWMVDPGKLPKRPPRSGP